MRLVSRLDALQRRIEADSDSTGDPELDELIASGVPIGVVWTSEEVVVDPAQARAGEHVAVDLVVDREASSDGCHPAELRTRERFSADPSDLGVVYNSAGVRIGRVMLAPRGLLRWVRDDAAARG
jgi:hypothetical protein